MLMTSFMTSMVVNFSVTGNLPPFFYSFIFTNYIRLIVEHARGRRDRFEERPRER